MILDEEDIIYVLLCVIGGTIAAGFFFAGPVVGVLVIIAWLLAFVLLVGMSR